MSITDLPKLYTDAEAAIPLRCSERTVERLRRSGKLGYTRVATKVYMTADHIQEYLRSQEHKVDGGKR